MNWLTNSKGSQRKSYIFRTIELTITNNFKRDLQHLSAKQERCIKMVVNVKPAALEELKKCVLQEGVGIRIQATFIGSCSIYAEYDLLISPIEADEDDVYVIEEIPFVISKESQKHLGTEIYLDFNPALGYKLSSNEETYRYNLRLKQG
jgi:Fe-S cluster assembly iron-binding protein IscA